MKQEKKIPFRNYLLLSFVLILTIILVIYFYMWYSKYQDSKLNSPIMDKYMQVVNYNELNDYLVENKDSIIYLSVLDNEDVRSFEIKFRKFIIDNSLQGKILYLDLTSELKDKKLKDELINEYQVDVKNMTNIPSIINFKDGSLINSFNIKENKYNIESLENYFVENGVLDD